MAKEKAVRNAIEAAGKKIDAPSARGGRGAAIDWRVRADELGVDAVAAREFDENLVPQIQAAGYPNSIIKGFLDTPDPHAAAKQFIADERMALEGALTKAGWGYTPEQMAGMNLRDLKETVADASKGGQPPSRIRNQNQEPAAVESRDGADVPRTESPNMDEAPAGDKEAAAVASAKAVGGRSFYKDGITRGGPGSFQDRTPPAPITFEAVADIGGGIQQPRVVDINAAPPPTPSMQELINLIDRQGTDSSKPKSAARQAAAKATSREQLASNPSKMQLQLAEAGAPQPAGGDAIYAGQGMPLGAQRVGVIEQRGGGAPPPGGPPGGGGSPPAGGPPGGPPNDPPPEVPKAVKNSRILAGAKGIGRNVRDNWFDYAVGGAAIGVPTAHGLGLFGGSSQPQQGNAQQAPAGGGPRIQILPRADLRSREVPVPQAPPMPQQPAPPQRAAPGRDETTDIIRQLSGRLA